MADPAFVNQPPNEGERESWVARPRVVYTAHGLADVLPVTGSTASEMLLPHEPWIRLGVSAGLFMLLAIVEAWLPRRRRENSRVHRWPGNLGVMLLDTAVVRVLVPAGAVGFAVLAAEWNWGWFNHVTWPGWLETLLAVVLLDLAIYGQHVLMHRVPLLWRVHRMHHTDRELDVTSGARFHPMEILLSLGFKFLVVIALGVSPLSILAFEITLNGTSLFNHSNLRLPAVLDAVLRRLLVTPDMHRVHHSTEARETDSNFGFNLPWWDRLFGTYRAQPAAGHDGMTLGLDEFTDPREQQLGRMFSQPWRGQSGPP